MEMVDSPDLLYRNIQQVSLARDTSEHRTVYSCQILGILPWSFERLSGAWLFLWLNADKLFNFLLERSVLLLLSREWFTCGVSSCWDWVPVSHDSWSCAWQSHSRGTYEAADKGPCEKRLKLELGTQNFMMTTISTLALPSHLSACFHSLSFSGWGAVVFNLTRDKIRQRDILSPLTLPLPYLKKTFDIYALLSITP